MIDIINSIVPFLSWTIKSEYVFYFGISIILLDHLKSTSKILILYLNTKFEKNNAKNKFRSPHYEPKFSILIPAYNADRIKETIQSAVETSYKNKEIIVIVNGNDEKTYRKAVCFKHQYPDLVTVHNLTKKGKAMALNYGLKSAKGKYIVTLDADAKIVNKKSLESILNTFEREKDVIAMSGDIQVYPGDNCVKNIWTKFQAIEYLLHIHIEKRIQTIFNTMLIIPGGFGVFKRIYLQNNNPFNEKSITEDFVISLDMHGYGKKVVFEPNAAAKFECPDTLSKLKAQRARWASGQIETLKLFHPYFFLPTYNRLLKIAILDMWAFEVIFNVFWIATFLIITPCILIFSGIDLYTNQIGIEQNPLGGFLNILENPIEWFSIFDKGVWLFILISFYLILETTSTLYAILISSRKECYNLLWYIPLYTFFYRPILRLLIFRGHLKGIRGKTPPWNEKESEIEREELILKT
ncbi:MAG: glycosyltransferase family 2 protein [Nitrosopumilus sp.]|nr:glycosyltransferase family 2 protein [Nitrosopumilus sp.]